MPQNDDDDNALSSRSAEKFDHFMEISKFHFLLEHVCITECRRLHYHIIAHVYRVS